MSLLKAAANCIMLKNQKKITEQEFNKRMSKMFHHTGYGTVALENMSTEPESTAWFIDERIADNKVSVAEQMIAGILDQYRVQYVQEVSMYGLVLPSGGYARYDFMLHIDTPYILCEYDSTAYHNTDYHHKRDALKTKWCKERNIKLIRWNKQHYYNMDIEIEELMNEYNIRKK